MIGRASGRCGLGEVTTPRLDRFVQEVLRTRGYATAKLCRSVLSGICGWLVRARGPGGEPGAGADAARSSTVTAPLERLSVEEMRAWLAVLDGTSSLNGRTSLSWLGSCWPRGCGWGRRWGSHGPTSTWPPARWPFVARSSG